MTPDKIDNSVDKLVSIVCPNSVPIYVAVVPESYAKALFCFPAVQEKIKRDGGEQVIGWEIWKTRILIEAEFHAIWKSPSGTLVDITPKHIPVEKILFLPNLNMEYNGVQVDNIRLNISNNHLVDDLIEVSKMIYRQTNKENLAHQHGEIHLSGKDAEVFKRLSQIKQGILGMINKGNSRNTRCFCGRDLKYKHCHGKDVKGAINSL